MSYKLTTIREIIGSVLCSFAKDNKNIFVIDSDLAKSTTTNKFQNEYPDRFIQTGISEQNALSVASGLAMEGLTPFYVNFAIFISGTCWTQLRQACYANLNIKLIATHPGMDNGYDGSTHHANEDIALMRVLPNMKILIPSNHKEFIEAVKMAISIDGPVYIRTARDVVPDIEYSESIRIGKLNIIKDIGNDFALIFEGTCADLAIQSFEELNRSGKKGKLINIFSIKPIDELKIIEISKIVPQIITLENHSIIGGLGSTVSEILCSIKNHAPVIRIGVNDIFTESGKSSLVKEKYGLSIANIVSKVK